jgi:hypothetical protein
MSAHRNPPMPARAFGFLLVEGGDEQGVCTAVAGPTVWGGLVCWNAQGRDKLVREAALAAQDPQFSFARSVGIVLDVENDPAKAHALASSALAVFGATGNLVHGVMSGAPRPLGVFLSPDGANHGAIETLCRRAVRDAALARCVDALVACAAHPHASHPNAQASADKGWLKAYLSMLADPTLRFHQAFSAPGGLDAAHAAFDPLRTFLGAL